MIVELTDKNGEEIILSTLRRAFIRVDGLESITNVVAALRHFERNYDKLQTDSKFVVRGKIHSAAHSVRLGL